MSEMTQVWLTTRNPTNGDAGVGIIGQYNIKDGVLIMFTEDGRTTGQRHKLWPSDDPNRIARGFLRETHRKRKESDSNRPIHYPPWKPA